MTKKEDGVYCGDGLIKKMTEKAMLVDLEADHGRAIWIPFSQIGEDSELHDGSSEGEDGKLYCKEWFAEKEKLT